MRSIVLVFGAVLLLQACGGPLYYSRQIYVSEADPKNPPDGVYLMTYYSNVASSLVVAVQKIASQSNTNPNPSPTPAPKKPNPNPNSPAPFDDKTSGAQTSGQISITVSVVNFPSEPRYLYFNKSALYGSSVDFSTDLPGLPTKSDTSSQQMVESALSEIGQTVGTLAAFAAQGAEKAFSNVPSQGNTLTDLQLLAECTKNLTSLAPLYKNIPIAKAKNNDEGQGTPAIANLIISPVPFEEAIPKSTERSQQTIKGKLTYFLAIQGLADAGVPNYDFDQKNIEPTDRAKPEVEPERGFWVYDATPIAVTPMCQAIEPQTDPIAIGARQIVVVYRFRHRVNPTRSFWTNRQDTYTITDGILVGHKYTDQSAVKTFVDLLTAPIRSALPSAQTTTNVSVQSTAGKPDQTTTSTSMQISAPKP